MDKYEKLRHILENVCGVIPCNEFNDPILITRVALQIGQEMGLIDENYNLTKEAIEILGVHRNDEKLKKPKKQKK